MIHDVPKKTPKSDNISVFPRILNTDNCELISTYLGYVNINKNPNKAFSLMILLGGWIYKSGAHNPKFFKDSPAYFYNQLVNRCFNDIKGSDKETFEKYVDILKSQTTQCACIMYAIVAYNMGISDKKKLNNVAKKSADTKASTDISLLHEIDAKADKITKIIKTTFGSNPQFRSIMCEVYNGNFPSTFVIPNTKKRTR